MRLSGRLQRCPSDSGRVKTHSSPASPVRLASLVGFSNKHSSPAWRQRLHGGFSAPSHRIFCLRQAF